LSGDEGDEDVDNQNEQWRVERLEREKWMQGALTPQTMNLVDMAIHRVVCQKSDFHGNT
jgi:hypothetical protein